jgi:hypothetical protein
MEYRTELLSREAEKELLTELANRAFKLFEVHGYQGKRYAISYRREYDFRREVHEAEALPFCLFAICDVASIPGCASTLRNRLRTLAAIVPRRFSFKPATAEGASGRSLSHAHPGRC